MGFSLFLIVFLFGALVYSSSLEERLVAAKAAHDADTQSVGALPVNVSTTVTLLENLLERNVRLLNKTCLALCDVDTCLRLWYLGTPDVEPKLTQWFMHATSTPELTKAAFSVLFTFYDQLHETWNAHNSQVAPIWRNQTHWQVCWKK